MVFIESLSPAVGTKLLMHVDVDVVLFYEIVTAETKQQVH